MAEFIRPLVEERLTKMEELDETWDDAPVSWPLLRGIDVIHHK